MNQTTLLTAGLSLLLFSARAQTPVPAENPFSSVKPALVDFKAYDNLIHEVQEHRKTRMLNLDAFLAASKEQNVVILDTRSDSMYNAKHVKGAIHLNFADFTQSNLFKLIPDPDTKILIYCNNNFDEGYSIDEMLSVKFAQPAYFVTKLSAPMTYTPQFSIASEITTKKKKQKPVPVKKEEEPVAVKKEETPRPQPKPTPRPLTLALNIPTYINLFGYGYKNVYELSELVSVNDPRIQFEGTAVLPRTTGALFVSPVTSLTMAAAPRNTDGTPAAHVDFGAYDSLAHVVMKHRETRLLHVDSFLDMSRQAGVMIIDTRSDAMYKAKHVKGAVHLNFSDFTQANLARLVPSKDTKILIYCNNNFENDNTFFATKDYNPPTRLDESYRDGGSLTLALNIPTYINLYGYGYKNVYELSDLVNVLSGRVEFEGTEVFKGTPSPGK